MFPNGFGMNGYWGKEYLTQHEYEIHSENDVDRLVRTYNQKR